MMTKQPITKKLNVIIDMEGDENPALDALNHEIELLHDPTHARSYTAKYWR